MNDYPPEWKSGMIQSQMYQRADWHCEHCGMEFVVGTTKAKTARNKDVKPTIFTVHYLDGDKSNCGDQNLIAVCQRCHLEVQALWEPGEMLPAKWHGVPEWLALRGLAYTEHPQMRMFRGD